MKLVFIFFALALTLELGVFTILFLWQQRNKIIPILIVLTAFTTGVFVMWRPNTLSVLLALVTLYRLFNLIRTRKGRMHEKYLRNVTKRTGLVLAITQIIFFGMWWLWSASTENRRVVWLGVAITQLVVGAILLVSTLRRLQHTKPTQPEKHYSDIALPTLSVAIPARNETQDLEECLVSLVGSNYPKLEILVLDDCSQNKRTPEIIRSFAHDGVRFIEGEQPKETWLPKNQAYDRLVREASGEYILFCGVDMRFDPTSLRKIISSMLARDKQMMSILPSRAKAANQSALLQAMRYWWELAPPRRLFRRPPVISSCWVIARKSLVLTGGFPAVSRSIVPEAFFARQLIANDGYSFIRSADMLGVLSVKSPAEQRDTAIRTRYPQLHRRPEFVFFVTLAELTLLVLPFITALAGWWLPVSGVTHVLAAIACVLLTITYVCVVRTTRVNSWLMSLVGQPIVALVDIAVLHISMWQYEFSEVQWKGRNVCIPVMHTYPHLPKIDD